MRRLSCQKVEERLNDYVAGSLSQEERSVVSVHLAVCDRCREAEQIWRGLSQAVVEAEIEPLSQFEERRLLSRRGDAGVEKRVLRSKESIPRRRVIIQAMAAAALLALGGLALLLSGWGSRNRDSSIERASVIDPVELAGTETSDSDSTPEGFSFSAASGDGLLQVMPGTVLFYGKNTELDVVAMSDEKALFRLNRGYVLADIGISMPGYSFAVETPSRSVEARGTVFSVAVGEDGDERVRVAEGCVEVRDLTRIGRNHFLTARQQIGSKDEVPTQMHTEEVALELEHLGSADGNIVLARFEDAADSRIEAEERRGRGTSFSSDEPAAAERRSSAIAAITAGKLDEAASIVDEQASANPRSEVTLEMMVKLAQAYRRSRRYGDAAATYERLIASFSSSPAAVNGLVALGQMKLSSMADPTAALNHFADYLARAPNGPLAPEARAGLTRAFVALNDFDRVITAADDYLSSHPGGSAAAEILTHRGDAFRAKGDCESAVKDYEAAIRRSGDSPQGIRAGTGLEACGSKN